MVWIAGPAILGCFLIFSGEALAHASSRNLTFSENVAPILYEHCVKCPYGQNIHPTR
jgi:hypothetical protein